VSRKLLNVELYFLVRDIHPIEEDDLLLFIVIVANGALGHLWLQWKLNASIEMKRFLMQILDDP
jgi:hypothetical protein